MKTATQSQQETYGNKSIQDQLDMIINDPKVFNNLRTIQKRGVKLIERSYYINMSLRQDEKEYLFNIYFNFVINKFSYSDKKPVTTKVKNMVAMKGFATSHIGMRMLNEMSI